MGFKLPGKSMTSGTSAHSSALKMKAEADSAFKQMTITKEDMKGTGYQPQGGKDATVSATGSTYTSSTTGKQVKLDPKKKGDKAVLETRWKKGNKASGGTLNELVAARKKHKKGSAEYAAIQNKINKSLGSKKVHKGTKVTKKGKTVTTAPKGTKKVGGEDVMKGLGANKGKTLSYTDKQAEKVKIEKANTQIKEGKSTGDKNMRDESQLEKAKIKSGRDNKKTGTVVSRFFAKRKAKRNEKQLKNRKVKDETPAKKALVGNQKNLPEHLKAKIDAAPGKMYSKSMAKKYKK